MKFIVLSDIHSNLHALQEVVLSIDKWKPDIVIVAGDIVNRGPRPRECLDLVLERVQSDGWLLIRGNHEDYVIARTRPDSPRTGPKFEVHRPSYWTLDQLGGDVSTLLAMPFSQSLTAPDGKEIRIVHGSMRGNRDGIYSETNNETLKDQIAPPPSLFCVGHTHLPLIRSYNGTLVVNVGSSGLPFDGDQRPSYARITWHKGEWVAEIVRVNYDIQAAERDFYSSGYLAEGGPLVRLVLFELRHASSQLYNWSRLYQEQTLQGRISLNRSVQEYLKAQDIG
ncbi:MAG: metallophosphoesterase family protein [Anaerolineales bacterium]|jgi:predicted phosphodiesterase